MMLGFTSISPLLLLLIVSLVTFSEAAAVLRPRIVPISNATTIAKGHLETVSGHKLSLRDGALHFGGKGLQVEFQQTNPNFGHFDGKGSTPFGGHIYVPATKKCLSIPEGAAPPFTFGQAKCEYSDDSSQTFSSFIKQKDGKIFFVGGTQKDGSIIYYGSQCKSGRFGASNTTSTGVAKFECADSPNVVALKLSS